MPPRFSPFKEGGEPVRIGARWLATAAVLGATIAWWATSPSRLILINWDQAAYVTHIARGGSGWSLPPWSNHFAVGQYQHIGVLVARALGGTTIDGFRLVKAVLVACTGAAFASAAFSLSRSRVIALGLTAAFLAAFSQLFLIACI